MKAGALIEGKYRLTRIIGEGAMGVVWEATNEGTSRQVAVKLIVRPTEELRHRLLREAKACGALRHRNIVDIYDVGTTADGDPFLVMQLLVGETLGERLVRQRRLDPPEAARIGRDVARALAAAHAASIIHRDLKPANIFLHDEPGEESTIVKVLDFGVSKNLATSDGLTTVAGGVVGSPAYMSPEQAGAGAPVDHRADIWSLGVVLFEMLTGKRPLEGDATTIIPRLLNDEIPPATRFVRTLDPALSALVGRCLEREISKRIASATDLAAQLQRWTGAAASSGGAPLGQSSPGAVSSPFVPSPPAPSPPLAQPPIAQPPAPLPPRGELGSAAAIASPRGVFVSSSDVDPALRSPRLQGGKLPSAPMMPSDDDDNATAKLDPRMLAPIAAARVQPEPATTPLKPNFKGTLPLVSDASAAARHVERAVPPPAPSFSGNSTVPASASGNYPAVTFGAPPQEPPPERTTAKLDPTASWLTDPTASITGNASGVTKHGTVRMPPDFTKSLLALSPAPPAPPPPPIATPHQFSAPPSTSTAAPLMQGIVAAPTSSSDSAPLVNLQRRRTALFVVGAVVGLALALLVVIGLRLVFAARTGQSTPVLSDSAALTPAAVSAPPSTASSPALAAPSTAPSATAPPAVSSAPGIGKPPGAGTSTAPRPAPGGVKPPAPQVAKPGTNTPPWKKVNPSGP